MTGGQTTPDDITGAIVDAAYKLHTGLGPGLLESVYETILSRDLQRRGLQVERQRVVSFDYDGMHFSDGLRIDLIRRIAGHRRDQISRAAAACSSQTVADLLAIVEFAGRLADQFWGADPERRTASDREWLIARRVSASPREQSNARSGPVDAALVHWDVLHG